MAIHESWFKLVADMELRISKGCTECGKVSAVGAKGDEGGGYVGGAALAVQQVGRVGAHFLGGRV